MSLYMQRRHSTELLASRIYKEQSQRAFLLLARHTILAELNPPGWDNNLIEQCTKIKRNTCAESFFSECRGKKPSLCVMMPSPLRHLRAELRSCAIRLWGYRLHRLRSNRVISKNLTMCSSKDSYEREKIWDDIRWEHFAAQLFFAKGTIHL